MRMEEKKKKKRETWTPKRQKHRHPSVLTVPLRHSSICPQPDETLNQRLQISLDLWPLTWRSGHTIWVWGRNKRERQTAKVQITERSFLKGRPVSSAVRDRGENWRELFNTGRKRGCEPVTKKVKNRLQAGWKAPSRFTATRCVRGSTDSTSVKMTILSSGPENDGTEIWFFCD